jgi:hypothetical protein
MSMRISSLAAYGLINNAIGLIIFCKLYHQYSAISVNNIQHEMTSHLLVFRTNIQQKVNKLCTYFFSALTIVCHIRGLFLVIYLYVYGVYAHRRQSNIGLHVATRVYSQFVISDIYKLN